jgi:ABC-type nitrate/sulfonate/bicarbonate transport system substrate-binding protein
MANLKIIAIAVVAVIVVAAVGIFLFASDNNNKRNEEISLIAGVQSVGSGIYYDVNVIDPSTLFVPESITAAENGTGEVIYRAAGWEGLIIGTPGTVAVQHIQLKKLIEEYLNDPSKVENGETKELKLVAWTQGQELKDGEVGYIVTTGSAATILNLGVDIGLTWQPQLALVDDNPNYDIIVRTNELFPHEQCCVLVANNSFLSANGDASNRATWAILQSGNWLNATIANGIDNPNDSDYLWLIDLVKTQLGGTATTDDVIAALQDTEFGLIDSDYTISNPLSVLKSNTANLAESLEGLGAVFYSVSSLGFDSYADYASALVDDSYVKYALLQGDSTPTYSNVTTVRFSLIAGSIHDLALDLANTKLPGQTQSFFAQAGINAQFTYVPTGAGVITALLANEADFGVPGLPSIVSASINNKWTNN